MLCVIDKQQDTSCCSALYLEEVELSTEEILRMMCRFKATFVLVFHSKVSDRSMTKQNKILFFYVNDWY